MREPPYRLCCGKPHWGPVCPDGLVMCQLCYDRVKQGDLHRDEEGTWDICQKCHEAEVLYMRIQAI